MFVAQREVGVLVMIEAGTRPIFFAVAALAFHPQTTLVRVVGAMAGHAGHRQLFAVQRALVTAFTLCQAVFATQRVARFAVVVETDILPVLLGVAAFAARAVAPLMIVIFAVAGVATLRNPLEFLVAVAVLAFHIPMLPD